MTRFDPIRQMSDLPGQQPVTWRQSTPIYVALACLAAAAWPPLVLTMLIWPPSNWLVGRDIDWRLIALLIGAIAVPIGLWIMNRERQRTGRPTGRLGIVWRFMLYGGLTAAVLQTVLTLAMVVLGWFEAGGLAQGLGATETTVLIFGIGGLPLAMLVGVSYALWAGLCIAFIAFQPRPPPVRDRLGMLDREARAEPH